MPDADPHGVAAAQRARVDARDDVALAELRCPKSWQIYFPDVSYDARDRRAELTRGLARFLTSASGRAFVREVRRIDRARGEEKKGTALTDSKFARDRQRWEMTRRRR